MKRMILVSLLLLVIAVPTKAEVGTPVATPAIGDSTQFGKGWLARNDVEFTYSDSSGSVLAHASYYGGPDQAQIRVIQAQLSILNAREFYTERLDDQDLFAMSLGAVTDQVVEEPEGCALSASTQGIERLVGLLLGSSICVTDQGRFLWVSIEGSWQHPDLETDDPLVYSAASSALVELILQLPQQESEDETASEVMESDLAATANVVNTEFGESTSVVADFGAIPTRSGRAIANNGDVESGCWTEAQRTTDGVQAQQWNAAPAMVIDPTQVYTAEIITNYGTMVWQLLPKASSLAVNNFVCLSRSGYYDGAPFHRIVDGFVIQGGDPTGTGMGGPGYTVPDSPVVGDYSVGMVTMARTAAPNSSGSQFFINTADNTSSFGPEPTYINFARVIGGQDTIDAIASVERVQGGDGAISSPVNPVILESVTIFEGGIPLIGMPEGNIGTPELATPIAASSGG